MRRPGSRTIVETFDEASVCLEQIKEQKHELEADRQRLPIR